MLRVISKRVKPYSEAYAREIGEEIGIDWEKVDFPVHEFAVGLQIEWEHGPHDPETNITGNDIQSVGKVTWAHLKEIPDYYTRLVKMEEANAE